MTRVWLLALLLMLAPLPAQALCLATGFANVPAIATFAGSGGEYSVYDTAEYMQTMSFNVSSLASVGGCKYYVVLSAGTGSVSQRKMARGTGRLDYNVYTSAGKTSVLAAVGSYNAAGTVSGTMAYTTVLSSNAHNLYWTIQPGQVVEADGTRFQDSGLTLQLWAELAAGVYTNVDSKTVTFRARPESSVDLSLVDTGGSFNAGDASQTVGFGTLATGVTRSYDTIVRSNDGYTVQFQSANGQVLRHAGYPGVATTIPYSVSFGGNPMTLAGGSAVSVASTTAVTSAQGDRFATLFTVGTMSGVEPPGNYQDVLTVTLSAN